MSDRPPAGWDAQGYETPAAPTPSGASIPPTPPTRPTADEVLAGHLRRRGARQPPRALAASIVARVAETAPERRWRLTLAVWRPRVAVAATGTTIALLAGLLFFSGPAPRTSTTQRSPSPLPSPTFAGLTWDPAQRALTPPELLRVLATQPAPGTVFIVDDQIIPRTPCLSADPCPIGELANAMDVLVRPPAGGHFPFLSDPATFTTSIKGPLALEVGTGPTLVFLGSVVSGGLRMSFLRAPDLAMRNAMGGLFVVQAWLWETPPVACPSVPGTSAPMPTSELGLPAPRIDTCSPNDWLTDTASIDPARHSGIEFMVQPGAYRAFGADLSGTNQANPRQGIYLVRDWAGYGEILGRLEPMPIPSADALGPSVPTIAPITPSTAGGIVMSVDELVARVQSGSLAPGSMVVASIPASAVSILSPSAAGVPDDPARSRWVIAVGSRFIRVDGIAASGIIGSQAFLVERSGSILTLGSAAVAADGSPLDGLAAGSGLSVVHGWLRIGPRVPCPRPRTPTHTGILGENLGWSQCPGTWILPSADDPWAGPPNNVQATDGSGVVRTGDSSVPRGTLHVQDGANGADLTPREGVWLVRLVASSACPPGDFCRILGPNEPPPGARWFELIGPVAPPNPAAVAPSPATPPIVLRQDRLVAGMLSGSFRTGSILIAGATIAPVILRFFPPDPGTVVGKIGAVSVHWASDPSLGVSGSRTIALRVRVDGDLDYLGTVELADGGGPFETSTAPPGPGLGLILVHGWLYRFVDDVPCVPLEPGPSTPALFGALDGRRLGIGCGLALILPSAVGPGQGGSLAVWNSSGATGVPTEGLFLVRSAVCAWSPPGLDSCGIHGDAWEFVGPVDVPGH